MAQDQGKKTKEILKNNRRENSKRIPYDYVPGDKVLVSDKEGPKLSEQQKGPFEVLEVFDNGTLRVQKDSFTEVINIRRLLPYHTE